MFLRFRSSKQTPTLMRLMIQDLSLTCGILRAILNMKRASISSHHAVSTDEDVSVTATTPTALERAIQRYGDDLYRMALLLTSDEAQAAATLRSAMRRMIDTPLAGISEVTLSAALVASLPPDRRRLRRRLPAWARLPAARAEAPLVAALAPLPRQQRLALGLAFLHGFDAPQAAAVLGSDEAQVRVLTRDALRALARHAGS